VTSSIGGFAIVTAASSVICEGRRDERSGTMIIQVSAGSPWWVRGAADAVLYAHIGAGAIGLLSGAAALAFRKGGRLHRVAGNVFFASMLTMAGIGTCVAPLLPQVGSMVGGAFTFYLVATGWMTVRRAPATVGRFERGALVFALGIAATGTVFGVEAAQSASGQVDDIPAVPYFVFATLSAMAAALDLRMILRGGIARAPRLARHLWRMCIGLLIAAFSFFLGQAQVFPAAVRRPSLLLVPELVILCLLVFWLVRVQLAKRVERGA
jgi:uncharacterized membrane protein